MLYHLDRNCPLRIICDAGEAGLRGVLQQEQNNELKPIFFASRFLTDLTPNPQKSKNELESLAVVWAVECF